MRWLAILNGKHWGDISPVIFHKHHRNKDWRMTLCDAVDTGGAMIEITRGDIRCYVPQDAVVAAVHIQYPNETVGLEFKRKSQQGKTVVHPNPYQAGMIRAVGGLERDALILSCTDFERVLKETDHGKAHRTLQDAVKPGCI